MSSIFDLRERVQRLRQMFAYFRNAALLTGAEVRDAAQTGGDGSAQEAWSGLLADLNACISAAQSLGHGVATPPPAASPPKPPLPASTLH